MAKQTYADNVDSNGVAYKTVGDNIREGAKGAESVVKALQSEDITFDMQALMNVLPFMDSTKKIIEINISASNGVWHADKFEQLNSQYGVGINAKCYGHLIGEINRGKIVDVNKITPIVTASPTGTNKAYIKFSSGITNDDDVTDANIKIFIVTDKTVEG